jgi:hypothetical protein
MSSQLEKIIALSSEIVELRSQKSQLDEKLAQRENELNSLITPVAEPQVEKIENESSENQQGKSITKGELKPGSVAYRVLKIMRSSPGRIFTPDELVEEESGMSRSNVANALFRITKNGQIEKVSHGQYTAVKKVQNGSLW